MTKPLFTLPVKTKKVVDPLESEIEKYGNDRLKLYGYNNYKLKSPSHNGLPDRAYLAKIGDSRAVLVAALYGWFFTIEYKRIYKGKPTKPTRLQTNVHIEFRNAGIDVLVVDSKAEIDRLFPKPKEAK